MQLPYEPKAMLHKNGGKIVRIDGVSHKTDRPQGGYSRDYWFYTGVVQWEDNGKTSTGNIDPGWLCAETQEGMDEINAASELMMDYLNEHGEWCDDGKHQGWYAHRKERDSFYYLWLDDTTGIRYFWSLSAQNWTTAFADVAKFDTRESAQIEVRYAERHSDAKVFVQQMLTA